MLTLFPASTPEHFALARELMTEYARALEFNLCFQNFEKEMAELPGRYAEPAGTILLALHDGRPAGVIALRPLEEGRICEMKRLYVRPAFRAHGIGGALTEAVIAAARRKGYSHMRLDSIRGRMDEAILMYRRLGFHEIPAYYQNPMKEALYLELDLQDFSGTLKRHSAVEKT